MTCRVSCGEAKKQAIPHHMEKRVLWAMMVTGAHSNLGMNGLGTPI